MTCDGLRTVRRLSGVFETLDDVDKTLLDQVEEFFISYNKSRGKKFKVKGRHGPKRAGQLVDAGIKKFRKKK